MIYGSIRVHTGPYGPIWVVIGEKSRVGKVKINNSDRDFFLGLFQGDIHIIHVYHILRLSQDRFPLFVGQIADLYMICILSIYI